MTLEDDFIKYYLIRDTDKIIELLTDVDFSKLDYTKELNQLMLYAYTNIKISYFDSVSLSDHIPILFDFTL